MILKQKWIVLTALMLAITVVLCACSTTAGNSTEDASWEYIQDKGTIIVGMDDSFPPMGYRENGELVGYDVDLAKEVGRRLGVEVELLAIDWKAKELELNSKNIDVIWNGFTITDERKENLLMSEPYCQNAQIIIVNADSDYDTLADLAGKNVAVQDGSSAQEAIAENEEFASSITQLDFKENVTALMDLSVGQVDAVAVDLVVANYYLAKDPGKYRILDEQLAPEEYGIGFRKGEQAFLDQVWGAIEDMQADGTFDEITERWFGK